MKHMAHKGDPLVQMPDDSFLYADDLTPLTHRERLRILVGAFVMLVVVFAVLWAIGFSGSSL